MVIIPTFNINNNSARFSQNIDLGGTIYNLLIYWNNRTELWFLDIRDLNQNPILTGSLLSPNNPIFANSRANQSLPNGDIVLIDLKNDLDNVDLTFDTFGVRYQVVFYTDEEIANAAVVS